MEDLPAFNAFFNSVSAILLLAGYAQIKKRKPDNHKKCMLAALLSSIIFLFSYLVYHYNVGSVPYPYHDWTRPVYFIILIPHILLAGIMAPFIILAVWHAWHENYPRHVRLVRWVFPIWLYVSASGVAIYFMLYRL